MNKAYLLVLCSYVMALVAASFVLFLTPDLHLLLRILIADVAGTVVVFIFSLLYKNSSFYDPYWSIVPLFILLYMLFHSTANDWIREILVSSIIILWGLRLTINWLYTWKGLDHIDWRYTLLKEKSGIFWMPVNFFGIHLIPTIIVFMACTPVYSVTVSGTNQLNFLDIAAFCLGLFSVWIEFQADRELHQFRSVRIDSSQVLNTGLWSWCRHPNYLGELGFWTSVFLFGAASGNGFNLLTISGLTIMLLLFIFVSIPLIEDKLSVDKPGYHQYKARTFSLLPLSRILGNPFS